MQFDVQGEDFTFEKASGGLLHQTYFAKSSSRTYLLQKLNTEVFPEPEKVMQNIALAGKYLHVPNYTSINFVPLSEEKKHLLKTAEGFWRVMEYIPGSGTFPRIKSEAMAFEAGNILGRFHHLLSHVPYDDFHVVLPDFHDLEIRWQQFNNALGHSVENRLEEVEILLPQISELHRFLDRETPENLIRRVCHNDTKLENILFDLKTELALGLIDLDTLMPGYFCFDFGDMARDIVFGGTESSPVNPLIEFNPSYFESMVKGIFSSGLNLRITEIQSLPYGVVLMPFLHGIRALTDYLSGDLYYKLQRENGNLLRGQFLVDIAVNAKESHSQMQEIIAGLH